MAKDFKKAIDDYDLYKSDVETRTRELVKMDTDMKTLKDAVNVIYNKNNCNFIKNRLKIVFKTFCIELMPKLYIYGFYCSIGIAMWFIQTIMVFTTYFRVRNYVKPG